MTSSWAGGLAAPVLRFGPEGSGHDRIEQSGANVRKRAFRESRLIGGDDRVAIGPRHGLGQTARQGATFGLDLPLQQMQQQDGFPALGNRAL